MFTSLVRTCSVGTANVRGTCISAVGLKENRKLNLQRLQLLFQGKMTLGPVVLAVLRAEFLLIGESLVYFA